MKVCVCVSAGVRLTSHECDVWLLLKCVNQSQLEPEKMTDLETTLKIDMFYM